MTFNLGSSLSHNTHQHLRLYMGLNSDKKFALHIQQDIGYTDRQGIADPIS